MNTTKEEGKICEVIAKQTGIGSATVRRAAKALDQFERAKKDGNVSDVLAEHVAAGKMDIGDAVKIVELPKDVQKTVIEGAERNQQRSALLDYTRAVVFVLDIVAGADMLVNAKNTFSTNAGNCVALR